jgi:hypothetical protein
MPRLPTSLDRRLSEHLDGSLRGRVGRCRAGVLRVTLVSGSLKYECLCRRCTSPVSMICVISNPTRSRHGVIYDGWQSFADSQNPRNTVIGYISQPSHAALAGQIAATLDPSLFGKIPDAVVEIIGGHDVGWAEFDLAALESTSTKLPLSFLGVPPEIGVAAWRRSIAAAERASFLAGALTRKHFFLLAPRDRDAAHRLFIEEQAPRVHEEETQLKGCLPDGRRFAAALGFCDLMSLHLCSGSSASVRIPLTHPADPESHKADYVTVSVAEGVIQVDRPRFWSSDAICIDGWILSETNRLSAMTFEWRLA